MPNKQANPFSKMNKLYTIMATMFLALIMVNYVQALSWTASGGCKTDWAGRCNNQCIGEASKKPACNGKKTFSGIESSNCVWGWNICKCQC
ncbi:hypothetical protein BGW38_006209 [Lunasporangiospora selenospora]|uniref:Uncharacterized protein n=1 Tax=Lunasporangiospora selenospora TaxID=979761 RepID=A0A9P6FZ86_9FUNG|nr:hypothetical protein BGW38_006209 [Lunasporangiospora selenospora]